MEIAFGQVNKKKPLNKRIWKNREGVKIPLGKMTRSHIRGALQWCMERDGRATDAATDFWRTKDGYTYSEWITMFITKLLHPDTLE